MMDTLRAKSMVLIKSAIQYNNSTTDSVVALNGAHLHVITPRQTGTCVDAEAVKNRLQRCARFDRPRIRILDLRL